MVMVRYSLHSYVRVHMARYWEHAWKRNLRFRASAWLRASVKENRGGRGLKPIPKCVDVGNEKKREIRTAEIPL